MKTWLSQLYRELIPSLCLLCDETLPGGGLACVRHRFPELDPQLARCPRCARRLPAGFLSGLECVECLKAMPAFERVHCAADYQSSPQQGMVREWLLAFKHGGRRELAEFFAQRLHERVTLPEPGCEPPLLVPVPLHRWRHLARGYDQAFLLARALGEVRGWDCARLLKRVRATRPQGSALALSREANVRAAFELRRSLGRSLQAMLEGRSVWLVDDVLTSGATADECARCLLRAGAARVEVVVVARA